MKIHLVDGTYELFRQHFGRMMRDDPRPNAATIGVLRSTLALLDEGATHVAVASDHVIESFRNDLWPGYKSSVGMPPELLGQLGLVEEASGGDGRDGVGDGRARSRRRPRRRRPASPMPTTAVEQVLILTPDKDLGQCVRGRRVVQFDRRKRELIDHDGVVAKFGVEPASIPDYLGLVGDSSDGFPGLPGWGARSAASVLARYGHLEDIPAAAGQWDVAGLRGAAKLAATLQDNFELALLFRRLATLVTDIDVGTVDSWRWTGPTAEFPAMAERLQAPELVGRAVKLASGRR